MVDASASAPLPLHTVSPTGLNVERVGVHLGARVTGVDLTAPISPERAGDIEHTLAAHGVLVFPDQTITSAHLLALGRSLGELSVLPFSTVDPDTPELIVYDNKEGNPPPPTDVWHADETFRVSPPKVTILCSKILPAIGGDTCFASMAAAYTFLSPRTRRFLEGLQAVHDFSVFKQMFPATPEGQEKLHYWQTQFPPSTHPVVIQHPITGEPVVYVTPQFTEKIVGFSAEDSERTLRQLYGLPAILEIQYRHRWEPNMVVMWDNRKVQHSALHDYYPQRRLMERVTIKGEVAPQGLTEPADPADLRVHKVPPLSSMTGPRPKRLFERD